MLLGNRARWAPGACRCRMQADGNDCLNMWGTHTKCTMGSEGSSDEKPRAPRPATRDGWMIKRHERKIVTCASKQSKAVCRYAFVSLLQTQAGLPDCHLAHEPCGMTHMLSHNAGHASCPYPVHYSTLITLWRSQVHMQHIKSQQQASHHPETPFRIVPALTPPLCLFSRSFSPEA